jgi:NAD(P)H-dependent FMN reductase
VKFLIFLGSIRDSQPPKPARVGLRVAKACLHYFQEQHSDAEFDLIDPLDFDCEKVFKPHFAYAQGRAPQALELLSEKIRSADGYVMVSPEYNHSMSPALAHLLNHFGSSLFAYKPSLIVTYSAGQWGGVRAAVAMRTFLSELGCLPVSAMIHVPRAPTAFDEVGNVAEGQDDSAWGKYFQRSSMQLIWWARAAADRRHTVDPHQLIENFSKAPSQRNAPGM